MKFKLSALIVVAYMALGNSALAWSGAGHMVIAAEAWKELPPGTKTKVSELLKAHPDYAKWKESFSGTGSLEEFVFMRASTWPDEIRRHGNKWDRPHWHYVDYPLRPPQFPMEPAPSPDDDILLGIAQSEKTLGDTKASLEERAVYLSWLIHLVGDISQPLHCASLFDSAHPSGDKGGNDFYVAPASRGIKLHSLWDGLLGTSAKGQAHISYAVQIQAQHPRKSLKELTTAKTPKDWSLEGRNLAIEKAYLHGALKGSTSAEAAPPLPEGYTKEAKAVAEKQAALAGYRLADEIGRLLK